MKLLKTIAIASIIGTSLAAAAEPKVTGGGEQIVAGGITFGMTVNAIDTRSGVKGSIQYSREANGGAQALSVHAKATCLWVSPDASRVVVAGPAEVQAGVSEGDWFFAAVKEGGTGSGDRVRAGFASETEGRNKCENGETRFPGLVAEGNFTIRNDN
jgi:hypothetical protein